MIKVKHHAKRAAQGMERRLRYLAGKPSAFMLHPGKTAGMSLKMEIWENNRTEKYRIYAFSGHDLSLSDLRPGEKAFFFLRDPVDRLVSGFYYRAGRSASYIFKDWRPEEREAFTRFPEIEDLAQALASSDAAQRAAARQALASIEHVQDSYWKWLVSDACLAQRRDDIIFVGRTETYGRDIQRLRQVLGLPDRGAGKAQNRSKTAPPKLSEASQAVLRDWLSEDYKAIRTCEGLGLVEPLPETQDGALRHA